MLNRLLPKFLFVALLFAAGRSFSQSWLEAAIGVDDLVQAGFFVAAEEQGTAMLALARSEFGEASEQLAESYVLLGDIQLTLEKYLAAESSFISAMEVYERAGGANSDSLIDPWIALGDTYLSIGSHERAFGAYEQARDIIRRRSGFVAVEQTGILFRMAEAAAALGDMGLAIDLQNEMLGLTQRVYGAGSEEVHIALLQLADWFSRYGEHGTASAMYNRASYYHRFQSGGDALAAVRLLQQAAASARKGLSATARRARSRSDNWDSLFPSTSTRPALYDPTSFESRISSSSYLNRALQILREQPGYSRVLEAAIVRDMGDWELVTTTRPDIAAAHYLSAWQLLQDIADGDVIARDWFNSTAPLVVMPLRSDELSDGPDALPGYVELEFTVRDNGTTKNIDVIAAEPEGLVEREARRRIDNSRFRPAIVDGQVVESRQTMRYEFRYDPAAVK